MPEAPSADGARWGRTVGRKAIDAYEVNILEPRPRSLLAVLVEAEKWGEREFVVFDDRRLDFARFLAATASAAARLRAGGLRPGDAVLVNAANSTEFLIAFWGILRAGGVLALANAWWSADELAGAVATLRPAMIVADDRREALIHGDTRFAAIPMMRIGAFMSDIDLTSAIAAAPDIDGDEERPAVLIYTSGATGKPKAAVLTHRALIAAVHNILHYRGRLPDVTTASDPQATVLCATPLFHVGGTLIQLLALLGGSRLVMPSGRSDAASMLDLIARERVTSVSTVPTLLSRLLDHPDRGRYDLSSLAALSAGGSAVSPDLMARARADLPNPALVSASTYGMTETGGSVTMIAGMDHIAHPTSCGRPFATCEVRIADPNRAGHGEILVRTPSAMSGYWCEPERSIIDEDGWIHTGDIGRLDADGFLHVTGRSKDIIIRGGENVAASVIEDRLAEHPDVAEAAVVGLPHRDLGEEIGAVVVPYPGASIDTGALGRFVREALAYFQVPSRWWVRDEPLPINPVGKVLKPDLIKGWPATEASEAPAVAFADPCDKA